MQNEFTNIENNNKWIPLPLYLFSVAVLFGGTLFWNIFASSFLPHNNISYYSFLEDYWNWIHFLLVIPSGLVVGFYIVKNFKYALAEIHNIFYKDYLTTCLFAIDNKKSFIYYFTRTTCFLLSYFIIYGIYARDLKSDIFTFWWFSPSLREFTLPGHYYLLINFAIAFLGCILCCYMVEFYIRFLQKTLFRRIARIGSININTELAHNMTSCKLFILMLTLLLLNLVTWTNNMNRLTPGKAHYISFTYWIAVIFVFVIFIASYVLIFYYKLYRINNPERWILSSSLRTLLGYFLKVTIFLLFSTLIGKLVAHLSFPGRYFL